MVQGLVMNASSQKGRFWLDEEGVEQRGQPWNRLHVSDRCKVAMFISLKLSACGHGIRTGSGNWWPHGTQTNAETPKSRRNAPLTMPLSTNSREASRPSMPCGSSIKCKQFYRINAIIAMIAIRMLERS